MNLIILYFVVHYTVALRGLVSTVAVLAALVSVASTELCFSRAEQNSPAVPAGDSNPRPFVQGVRHSNH